MEAVRAWLHREAYEGEGGHVSGGCVARVLALLETELAVAEREMAAVRDSDAGEDAGGNHHSIYAAVADGIRRAIGVVRREQRTRAKDRS